MEPKLLQNHTKMTPKSYQNRFLAAVGKNLKKNIGYRASLAFHQEGRICNPYTPAQSKHSFPLCDPIRNRSKKHRKSSRKNIKKSVKMPSKMTPEPNKKQIAEKKNTKTKFVIDICQKIPEMVPLWEPSWSPF